MNELTKEHFDQQLKNLVTQTGLEAAFDKQAILINQAFQGHTEHMDERFEKVDQRFDKIEDHIERIETKVDKALHTEYINLEVRVKRIEQKVGLKPIKQSI